MAKPIKPKVKGRKRIARTKRPPKAKSPPGPEGLVETLHLRGDGKSMITFTFSADIIVKLMDLHDGRFHPLLYVPRQQRMRRIRLQFVRLMDAGIPAIMIMIEPPSYDPRGQLTQRDQKRFTCCISARRIGLNAFKGRRDPFWFWAENMLGLIINLPEDDISLEPPRKRPGDPMDLVARR